MQTNFHRQDQHLFEPIYRLLIICIVLISVISVSCTKLVEIPPPINSITTSEVFIDSADAAAAVQGIYSNLINTGGAPNFGSGSATIYLGCSADELLPFYSSGDQFSTNQLQASNGVIYGQFWTPMYSFIYHCNAILEGLQSSKTISKTTVDQLSGETKFLRSFMYFYLINVFGDVPFITTTDYHTNSQAARTPSNQIYKSIITDLLDAENKLKSDYSTGGGERIRANKWAATALLAKCYLFTEKYDSAFFEANKIISNSTLYGLETDLNNVFKANSSEAILQWQLNSSLSPIGNATWEGNTIIPYPGQPPAYYLTDQLLNAFEPGDNRRHIWLDSTVYSGQSYTYPFKYTSRYSLPNTSVEQYYMVLRLGEQYLIRAEAQANGVGNGLVGAIEDLNVIRSRAGLKLYSGSTDAPSVKAAILHEREVELFSEWGNRWLDLKRSGFAHDVLSQIQIKQPWLGDYQLLYPIPATELRYDPSLKQNSGY